MFVSRKNFGFGFYFFVVSNFHSTQIQMIFWLNCMDLRCETVRWTSGTVAHWGTFCHCNFSSRIWFIKGKKGFPNGILRMSIAIDVGNWLALQNTPALEYCIDSTQDDKFKMTPSIWKFVRKCCSLFDFKTVLEQLPRIHLIVGREGYAGPVIFQAAFAFGVWKQCDRTHRLPSM